MNKKSTIIIIVVAVIALGGIYALIQSNNNKMMMEKKMAEEKMMKDEAMKKDDAMMEEKTMMKGDVMEKDEAMMKENTMMAQDDSMMMKGGQYVAYDPSKIAFAKEGKVVLFFNASWCPTCKAVDADIKASLSDIPKNTLILSVDYDSNKDLKTKYGVTTQHTFVQVDAEGKEIAKWVGGDTLEKILSNVK